MMMMIPDDVSGDYEASDDNQTIYDDGDLWFMWCSF